MPNMPQVEHLVPALHEAHAGPAAQRARLQHREAHAQLIARTHRQQPLQLLHARRTEAGRAMQIAVAHHAHRHRSGVPAAGNEAAEHRRPRRRLVEVEGLRIELRGKPHDVVFLHDGRSEFADLPFAKVLPVEQGLAVDRRGGGHGVGPELRIDPS
jgi:hypothetical protein